MFPFVSKGTYACTCACIGVYSWVGRCSCRYHFVGVRNVVHERDVELQGLVVQMEDNTIFQINHYPMDYY